MLILYSTLGCHLCEQATSIIHEVLEPGEHITVVDIATDDTLVDRYGIRIPVVYDQKHQRELGWPFSREVFVNWLAEAENV